MPRLKGLSLRIEGTRITHDRFLRAAKSFFDLLEGVTADIAGSSRAVDWIVSVRGGSIDLGTAPRPASGNVPVKSIVDAAYAGLKQLQKQGDRPPHFTDSALKSARELAASVDGYSVTGIQVRQSRGRFHLDDVAAYNVDALLGAGGGGGMEEIGTIEGHLETMSARDMDTTGSLSVGVRDALEHRLIRCIVGTKDLEKARENFGYRVEVFGTIHYHHTGEPMSIEAERIERLPDADSLPTAAEVYGILSGSGQ